MIFVFTFAPVYAEAFGDTEIVASIDKEYYETGDTLTFSGQVEEKKMPILALRVYDPTGAILSANNVEIDDNSSFSKIILLDSPFYDQLGTYSIKIDYGKLNKEIFFDIISDELVFVEEEPIVSEIISLESGKSTYVDNDTITITGSVSTIAEPTVLVGIYDPFGIPKGFYFGIIDSNKEFSVNFLAKYGVNFKIEGKYYATAFYGESKDVVFFDFVEPPNEEIFRNEIEESIPTESVIEEPKVIEDFEIKPSTPNESISKETEIENSINENKSTDTKSKKTKQNVKEKKSSESKKKQKTKADNLSVEDVQLGKILNQITLNCGPTEYVDTISYYDGKGPALIRLCDFTKAIHYFDYELKDDPLNVEILTNKGSALAKLGYYDEAILHYDTALEIDSSYIPALNNKGNALSQIGKLDEAVDVYTVGLTLDPDNKILNENFEKSNGKIIVKQENKEALDNLSFYQKNSDIANELPSKSIRNRGASNLLEQFGNVFSVIVGLFGFN